VRLDVVTPKGSVLSSEIDEVSLPGVRGEFGILPGHTPFVSALKPGVLVYREKGGQTKKTFAVGAGFAEVVGGGADGQVTVLSNRALLGSDVDAAEAQKALAEAEAQLKEFRPGGEESTGELEDRAAWARAQLDAKAQAGK
jgi:F-type H+-transporting ATPase subunit epsilon